MWTRKAGNDRALIEVRYMFQKKEGKSEMDEFMEMDDTRSIIKNKLRQYFDGKIVRKDLTKHIKEGANVPVYVLEFLLGQYCSSDDEDIIEEGVNNVKRILVDNFVRPDEAQKVLSILQIVHINMRHLDWSQFTNPDRCGILLIFLDKFIIQLQDTPNTATKEAVIF